MAPPENIDAFAHSFGRWGNARLKSLDFRTNGEKSARGLGGAIFQRPLGALKRVDVDDNIAASAAFARFIENSEDTPLSEIFVTGEMKSI